MVYTTSALCKTKGSTFHKSDLKQRKVQIGGKTEQFPDQTNSINRKSGANSPQKPKKKKGLMILALL